MLLSVTPESAEVPESAMVWVSDEYRAQFLQLIEDYLSKDTEKGKPKNHQLIANMTRIRAAVLDDLWQSDGQPPKFGPQWWELWLRPEPEAITLLQTYAELNNLQLASRQMRFDSRQVVWVGTPAMRRSWPNGCKHSGQSSASIIQAWPVTPDMLLRSVSSAALAR